MPVSQRDIIDLSDRQPRQIQQIGGSATALLVIRPLPGKGLRAAVGQHNAGLVTRKTGKHIRRAQPIRGVGHHRAAQQRTRKYHSRVQLDRGGLQQHAQIRSEGIALALKERLFPDASRTRVVVVAGDREHRHPDLPDRAARRRDCCLVRARRIEKVARDQHKRRVALLRDAADALDRFDPLLLHQRPFVRVPDARERFPDLPVCCMDEDHGFRPSMRLTSRSKSDMYSKSCRLR